MRVSRVIRRLENALKDSQTQLQATDLLRQQLQNRLNDETALADQLQQKLDALNQEPDQLDPADETALGEAEALLGIDAQGNSVDGGPPGTGSGTNGGGGDGGAPVGAGGVSAT